MTRLRLALARIKARGPLRLGEMDTPDVYRYALSKPFDRGAWAKLSDSLMDSGHYGLSQAALAVTKNPRVLRDGAGAMYLHPLEHTIPAAAATHYPVFSSRPIRGTAGGLRYSLDPTPSGKWLMGFYGDPITKPDGGTRSDRHVAVHLHPEEAARVIHETEGVWGNYQNAHSQALDEQNLAHAKRTIPHPDAPQPHALSAMTRARRALKLEAESESTVKRQPKELSPPVGPEKHHTIIEREALGKSYSENTKAYEYLTHQAKSGGNSFGGPLPSVKTLTTVAELGAPAKGEYKRTLETVQSLFGHDPDGVPAWQAVNAAFSPQTAYLDHAGAASILVANWLAAGKPKDPDTIRTMIDRIHTFGKLYTPSLADKLPWRINPKNNRYAGVGLGQTFGGTTASTSRKNAVVDALTHLDELKEAYASPGSEAGRGLQYQGGAGFGKVPNFAISYSAPDFGAALDVHMARLMLNPSLDNVMDHSDVLSQVKYQLSDPTELNNIEKKAAKGYPVRSELVKTLMKHPQMRIQAKVGNVIKQMSLTGWLKELNGTLLQTTPYYMAYKNAVIEAARRLKWKVSEVQESVWTGIVALTAAKSAGIPLDKIQEYLTHDAVRKGWQNHEAFIFPGVVDAYRRAGTDPSAVRALEQRTLEGAAKRSRPGIIPVSDPAHLRRIAAYLPESSAGGRDAAGPIRKAILDRLLKEGVLDPKTKKFRLRRPGEPVRFAQYDAPVDFVSALQRAVSSNHATFTDHLKKVLEQSGITPHDVSPAVHDTAAGARVSVIAAGAFKGGNVMPQTGAAWTGLLGRQPGMLTFMADPNGPDSVYRFQHQDADAVRMVLDQVGAKSRVFAPRDKTFHVFVYDPGRTKREGIAQALQTLGTPAEEWRGRGTPIGGNKDDMGREQYRNQINQAEAAQFARPSRLRLALQRLRTRRV